jgi:2-polyprenyl-3-methyl-5-hydroxy-6-metoxy-1,4-benzoquinol methylase/uncharacterized protein YbaR (Trm112 family)
MMQDGRPVIYHHHNHKPEEIVEDVKTQGPWLYLLEKHCGTLAGASILDVGCGLGGLMLACSNHGAHPVGVDPSHIIHVARTAMAQTVGRALPLVRSDGRALPFKADSFDIVVSVGVLEHITRPKALIEEMVRVLKPGGTFLLYFGPNSLLRFAQSSQHRNIVLSYWTPKDAEDTMRQMQLSIIRKVWTDVVRYRFQRDSFTIRRAGLYGHFATSLIGMARRFNLVMAVTLVCRALETISLQRNIGLIATKKPGFSQPQRIPLGANHFTGVNKELVDILECPSCKSELDLNAEEVTNAEIVKGTLYCRKCDCKYPIVDAIPEFLPSE